MAQPEAPDPSKRQDQADARANQMDTRSNQSDQRQDAAEKKAVEDRNVISEQGVSLAQVLETLKSTADAMQGVERRVGLASKDLRAERKRDQNFLRIVAVVALLSLFGSAMGSIAAVSVCAAANETRSTIRIIIAASYGGREDSLAPTERAELAERRREFQKVVDSRTKPLNCANPVTYFSRE